MVTFASSQLLCMATQQAGGNLNVNLFGKEQLASEKLYISE